MSQRIALRCDAPQRSAQRNGTRSDATQRDAAATQRDAARRSATRRDSGARGSWLETRGSWFETRGSWLVSVFLLLDRLWIFPSVFVCPFISLMNGQTYVGLQDGREYPVKPPLQLPNHFHLLLQISGTHCQIICHPYQLFLLLEELSNITYSCLLILTVVRNLVRLNQLNVSHFVIYRQLLPSHSPEIQCRPSKGVPSEHLWLVKWFISHRLHTGACVNLVLLTYSLTSSTYSFHGFIIGLSEVYSRPVYIKSVFLCNPGSTHSREWTKFG